MKTSRILIAFLATAAVSLAADSAAPTVAADQAYAGLKTVRSATNCSTVRTCPTPCGLPDAPFSANSTSSLIAPPPESPH
ncbi:MAG: hypothetical protein EXS32_15335 [Opitutus sp.]|nr:hypothetical protein [Opitutus sp.]